MDKTGKIYIAGHTGLVGSAILNKLKQKGYQNFILRSHAELDLIDQQAVNALFSVEKPEYVILAAAQVGGIMANSSYRADFIYNNLMIQNNVIHASYIYNVKKLLFLGSTCIYPQNALQPISENSLLTSPLEYTNEPYAIAKIAGIKMCESYNIQYGTNFISVMPTNLYGPDDNFNLETSHVLPAMIRKIHLAKCLQENDWDNIKVDLQKRPIEDIDNNSDENVISDLLAKYGIYKNEVVLWGTGKPMREFLWSEDMADACISIMENIDFQDLCPASKEIRNTHINIGTGKDLSIHDTANIIKSVIGFNGNIFFNSEKPDGTFRKLTDVSKLHAFGWHHSVEIEEGISKLYYWYLNN